MATNSKRSDRRRREIADNNRMRHESGSSASQHRNLGQQGKGAPEKLKKFYFTLGQKVALAFCSILLVFVLAALSVVIGVVGKINLVSLNKDELSIYDDLQYEESGYLNVALFGLDTRANNEEMGTRSDTIMIVSLNRETKEVRLSSIYRDTLLQQEDGTYDKANAAYSYGGQTEAIALLNRNLDLDIQHYVSINFDALVHVINALGGIEVDVLEDEIFYINGYGSEITENTGVTTTLITAPGVQVLDGVQATAYARIRYVGNGDYQRTERQRYVLTKVLEKAQAVDLGAIAEIIDKVFPMIETNFTLTEIMAYAKDIAKYQLGETVGFPFEVDTMDYGNSGNCVIPIALKNNVVQLHTYFFPELEYTPSSKVEGISDEIEWIYHSAGGTLYHEEPVDETVQSESTEAYDGMETYDTSGTEYGYDESMTYY